MSINCKKSTTPCGCQTKVKPITVDNGGLYFANHTRDFFKGQSFRYSGEWKKGTHYTCDEYAIDFVSKNNCLLACTKSHLSSQDNEPNGWVFRDDIPYALVSPCWEVVLRGVRGVEGKVYIPTYNTNTDSIVWTLTTPNKLQCEISSYLGLKPFIAEVFNPFQEDLNALNNKVDENKVELTELINVTKNSIERDITSARNELISDINDVNDDLTALINTKQDTINNSNKLSADYISGLVFVNGTGPRSIKSVTSERSTGYSSYAEGLDTAAIGDTSHAEGDSTIAEGVSSHAEGETTIADGNYSHAEGLCTVASNIAEHAEGSYNFSRSDDESTYGLAGNTASSIGIGTNGANRKNAVEVMQNGEVYINGIGGYTGSNQDLEGISSIQDIVPAQASSVNKLADKAFVNAQISSASAKFLGTYIGRDQDEDSPEDAFFAWLEESFDQLNVDVNDYVYLQHADDDGNIIYSRYKWDGNRWLYEYTISNNNFTSAEWQAIRSGATAQIINSIAGKAEKSEMQILPVVPTVSIGGSIEPEDKVNIQLRNGVSQDVLIAHQDISGKVDRSEISVTEWVPNSGQENPNKSTIQLKNGLSIDVITDHQDLAIVSGAGTNSAQMKMAIASGTNAIAEGEGTTASGNRSHAEGNITTASGANSHAEGYSTIASGNQSHAEGTSTVAGENQSHAEGYQTKAFGKHSHSEGKCTIAISNDAHAEGEGEVIEMGTVATIGEKQYEFVPKTNKSVLSVGDVVFSNNIYTIITNVISSGNITTIDVRDSFGELDEPTIISKVTGVAARKSAHSEGLNNVASEVAAHAEGTSNTALADSSHAEGIGNTTPNVKGAHVEGAYAVTMGTDSIHVVGYGTDANHRKNCHVITTNGNHYIPNIGGYNGTQSDLSNVRDLASVINSKADSSSLNNVVYKTNDPFYQLAHINWDNIFRYDTWEAWKQDWSTTENGDIINSGVGAILQILNKIVDASTGNVTTNPETYVKLPDLGNELPLMLRLEDGSIWYYDGDDYNGTLRNYTYSKSEIDSIANSLVSKTDVAYKLAHPESSTPIQVDGLNEKNQQDEFILQPEDLSAGNVIFDYDLGNYLIVLPTEDGSGGCVLRSLSTGDTYFFTYNSNLGWLPTVEQHGFITKTVNDLANYYKKSETYSQTEINNLIGAINSFRYEIASSIEHVNDPQSNVLYLIGPSIVAADTSSNSGGIPLFPGVSGEPLNSDLVDYTTSDLYEEYVYTNNQWVKIGETKIDLSGYATTQALNNALTNYTDTASLNTLLSAKQDTISDLSTIRSGASKGATAIQYTLVSDLNDFNPENHNVGDFVGIRTNNSQDVLILQLVLDDDRTVQTYHLHGVASHLEGDAYTAKYYHYIWDETISEWYEDVQARLARYDEIPSWALASTKPTYTASEVGALSSDTVLPIVAGTGSGSAKMAGATAASGNNSFAEGNRTSATANNAHAEGYGTVAGETQTHAEGNSTKALGKNAHAEGFYGYASGFAAHAEGRMGAGETPADTVEIPVYIAMSKSYTDWYALFKASSGGTAISRKSDWLAVVYNGVTYPITDAVNENNENLFQCETALAGIGTPRMLASVVVPVGAIGEASHVEGYGTATYIQGSHAEGKYNKPLLNSLHTVGCGTAEQRMNAHLITDEGKHYILGLGGYLGTEDIPPTTGDLVTVINAKASSTTVNNKIDKMAGYTGHIPQFNSVGGLTSSGKRANDLATKSGTFTTGHLAAVDSSGNIVDSGKQASDFPIISGATTISVLTQSDYDALTTPDPNTLYFIKES